MKVILTIAAQTKPLRVNCTREFELDARPIKGDKLRIVFEHKDADDTEAVLTISEVTWSVYRGSKDVYLFATATASGSRELTVDEVDSLEESGWTRDDVEWDEICARPGIPGT